MSRVVIRPATQLGWARRPHLDRGEDWAWEQPEGKVGHFPSGLEPKVFCYLPGHEGPYAAADMLLDLAEALEEYADMSS